MPSRLVRISYRFLAALWIILLQTSTGAWADSNSPSFPDIRNVTNLSRAVQGELGDPTAYVMCQDYANAFYRRCLENRWSCIPQQIFCAGQSSSHAVVLVQINATQCVFADPTQGTVVGLVFECANVRNSSTVWLTGSVCASGQQSCNCDRTSVPGGWRVTFSNPQFPALTAMEYSELYFLITNHGLSRRNACLNTCSFTVQMLRQQAQGCVPSATNPSSCQNLLASIPRWESECRNTCQRVLG